ncbi:MAG: 2-oxoacid:ferredoxin oxidoreductase subunit alpha [Thermofilaceae archaeon]
MREVRLLLGGPQGGGLETAMMVLLRALALSGYGVLASREYYSNIVGRHSYILARACSNRTPLSLGYPVHVVAAMDAESVFTHAFDLAEGGILVFDADAGGKRLGDVVSMEDYTRERIRRRLAAMGVGDDLASLVRYLEESAGVKPLPISYRQVLARVGERLKLNPAYLSRYVSSVIVGAVSGLLGLSVGVLEEAFKRQFKGRVDLVGGNVAVVEEVLSIVESSGLSVKLDGPGLKPGRYLLVSGNDAVAMGKVAGGLRYQSYYPITPAADESLALERVTYAEPGGVPVGPILVLQTEDEIAAVASAIGAALAGARSATSTSGPGFDLMVEGISYAGMNEVPIVITYYQRGGPSTGQPTRGAQSDLFNAIFAGHGEFARVVISSGDHEEAFYDAVEAFNIAERYQVPVIHLLDKFVANSVALIPFPDVDSLRIDRGNFVRDRVAGYRRFSLDSLVSPRAPLGSAVMWYTGDEHDEYGHISEDPEIRERMYRKRIEKMDLIRRELPRERKLTYHGPGNPDFLVVGWGSVKGVALEALELLEERGLRGGYVNLKLLWPFPSMEVLELLSKAKVVIAVEHSFGALASKLLMMEAGFRVSRSVVKYTGRPITLDELVAALERILVGGEEKVVLTYGA